MSRVAESKYNLKVNPVYQIDWHQEASGKRVAATKRRVRFRFGFSNREAIERGLSGTDCRGEEHEVVLVWSLTSGKRLIVADGEEIHFSTGKFTDSLFETSWQIAGGHVIKIIAYAAPPLFATPGFRQFDLQLDGFSFFDMPKIYQLGRNGGSDTRAEHSHYALPAPEEEYNYPSVASLSSEPDMAPVTPEFAIRREPADRRNTMPELAYAQRSQPVYTPSKTAPPRSQPAPDFAIRRASVPELPAAAQPAPHFASMPELPASQPAHSSPLREQTAPPPQPAFAQQPQAVQQPQVEWTQTAPVHDEFAPVPPTPPTQAQVYANKSHQIMSAYTPSAVPALTYAPHYSEYDAASPGATLSDVSDYEEESLATPSPPVLKPTMQPLAIAEMEERESEPLDEVDRAMKSLVNLDDINFSLETPEQAKMVRRIEEKKAADTSKSAPLPPTAPQWHLGVKPALQDIKKHSTPKEPTKEVMRTHAFDPNAARAGMMVVYGATTMAPPPQQGFGVAHGFGAHPAHVMSAVPPPPLY